MEGTLDVQRDYRELITAAARLLTDDGILLFCTNYRRFKLDVTAFEGLTVSDVSASSVPYDFSKSPRIHQCWRCVRNK